MTKPVAAATVLAMLPLAVRNRLEELLAAIKRTLGDRVDAVVLHGSTVRGGYRHGDSDVDVILVVKDDNPAHLAELGPALRLARAAARIEVMILQRDEIPRAADVFPLLYDDIRAAHSILFGSDPFADLIVHDEHRRLRIEQELRDVRIRLRRLVAVEGLESITLAGPLARKLRQLRSPLLALLTLKGKRTRDDLEAVLHGCSAIFKIDVTPLLTPARDIGKSVAALQKLLDAAIDAVDTHSDAREAA